jgi:hypothetical protein
MQQKWSSCSWLLLQEFVKLRQEQEKERREALENGTFEGNPDEDLPLPTLPYASRNFSPDHHLLTLNLVEMSSGNDSARFSRRFGHLHFSAKSPHNVSSSRARREEPHRD